MSTPVQLVHVPKRRVSHRGFRLAARIVMGAICLAVALIVFGAAYTNLPR